jgi:hypothetical protein
MTFKAEYHKVLYTQLSKEFNKKIIDAYKNKWSVFPKPKHT